MQMELPFTHQNHQGRVIVTLEKTLEPADLGARKGAVGLANCRATIEFDVNGYLALGWIQLRSTDNSFRDAFEMDPFDPFDLQTCPDALLLVWHHPNAFRYAVAK
jgi:hypothetical protein